MRTRLDLAGLKWPIEQTSTYFTIPVPADGHHQIATALEALRQVFGIAWLAPAIRFPHHNFCGETQAEDFARLYGHLGPMAKALYGPGKTFCVRAKRPNKAIPFTSPQLGARIGEWLIDNTPWQQVNLREPDLTFQLELHRGTACLFSQRLTGPGGLPVGTAGRVVTFLSGGIDSPVAAYLMAKRGCAMDFIHFTASFAEPSQVEQGKIGRLAKILNNYTLGSRLFVVPYTYFDMALLRKELEFEVILFRRFMVRVAVQLAHRLKCQALVSGDNLSQVASQTLSNLASTARIAELPLLQPLLGFDKDEIIQLAKRIGTHDESLRAYKDCCALISRHPRTHSKHRFLRELEERELPDYAELIDKTLAEAICLEMK